MCSCNRLVSSSAALRSHSPIEPQAGANSEPEYSNNNSGNDRPLTCPPQPALISPVVKLALIAGAIAVILLCTLWPRNERIPASKSALKGPTDCFEVARHHDWRSQ